MVRLNISSSIIQLANIKISLKYSVLICSFQSMITKYGMVINLKLKKWVEMIIRKSSIAIWKPFLSVVVNLNPFSIWTISKRIISLKILTSQNSLSIAPNYRHWTYHRINWRNKMQICYYIPFWIRISTLQ